MDPDEALARQLQVLMHIIDLTQPCALRSCARALRAGCCERARAQEEEFLAARASAGAAKVATVEENKAQIARSLEGALEHVREVW